MTQSLTKLADYLQQEQDAIITRWMEASQQDETLQIVRRLNRSEFRDNIPAAIEGLCVALRDETFDCVSADYIEEVGIHGHHRWKQGFNLREVIRDWGNLNRVLVQVIHEFYRGAEDVEEMSEAMDCLATFLTDASSLSVRRFDELRQAEAASIAKDLEVTKETFEKLTKARGALLREAAHDLRGGLSVIASASEVLKFVQSSDTSLTDLVDALDEGVQSVRSMLESLLDLSRLESGAEKVEFVRTNISEVLRGLAHEQRVTANNRGLNLFHEGPEELIVETDPQKVRRIAQNLLINGIEYTPVGHVKISWQKGDRCWTLIVSDSGPGVQEDEGSPIAQEMDNTEEGHIEYNEASPGAFSGEGIGLTIVRRLCELLDAGIELVSVPGEGSTFSVEFPLQYEKK